MLYISSIQNDLVSVIDTEDWKEEVKSREEILKLEGVVRIRGLHSGNIAVFDLRQYLAKALARLRLAGKIPNNIGISSELSLVRVSSDNDDFTGDTIVTPDGLKVIGKNCFAGLKSLKHIKIGSGVVELENNCFAYCPNLEKVELPSSVEDLSPFAFDSCTSLENIEICCNLKYLSPDCFFCCTNLKNVTITSDAIDSVEDRAFYGCEALETIVIQNKTKRLKVDGGRAGILCADLFCDRHSLRSVKITSKGTGYIHDRCFLNCYSLRELMLPPKLEYIGKQAFRCCHRLTSIKFPNSLRRIRDECFDSCTSLNYIEIPINCCVEDKAFEHCIRLERIRLVGTLYEDSTVLNWLKGIPALKYVEFVRGYAGKVACRDLGDGYYEYKVKRKGVRGRLHG